MTARATARTSCAAKDLRHDHADPDVETGATRRRAVVAAARSLLPSHRLERGGGEPPSRRSAGSLLGGAARGATRGRGAQREATMIHTMLPSQYLNRGGARLAEPHKSLMAAVLRAVVDDCRVASIDP